MTIPSVAKHVASEVDDPVMSRATEIVFGQCGNCLKRVKCSSQMVNIPLLMRVIVQDEHYYHKPSRYAIAAARVFKRKCGQCDQLKICLHIWGAHNKCEDLAEPAAEKLRELAQKDEESIAYTFEGYLKRVGLSSSKLMVRAAKLWWKCDKDDSYKTTTMVCIERASNAKK